MQRRELVENIFSKKSFLCVGLDPDPAKMPKALAEKGAEGIFEFNKAIIDATAAYAVAFKPNLAFYETLGASGMKAFEDTCSYIKTRYPEIFLIADAKRGDIGNTARMYAKAFFEGADVDAVTVAPYMGEDSVTPFLGFEGKWAILLALTSNKGSEDFQMLPDKNGVRMFQRVVKRALKWGSPVNMMFVVGATRGEYIADVRAIAPRNFFLVPGVGAQGGSLEDVCKYGMIDEVGLLVNSSRGIIHASAGDDFAEKAAEKAAELRDQMAVIIESRFGS